MGRSPRIRQQKLPSKLKAIRDALGLSQSQMLKKLGLDELGRPSISGWEIGKTDPHLYVLVSYADAANISMDTLIRDEVDLPNQIPYPGKRHSPYD